MVLAEVHPGLESDERSGFVIMTAAADDGLVDIHDRKPLAHDAINVLGAALVAWIHARAGRRTEIQGFGVIIKANSVEEAGQLLEKLSALKESQDPSDKT